MSVTIEMIAVCSTKRRASTQTMKGNQWWARDVYHLRKVGSKVATRCGLNCAEWLVIGPLAEVDDNCCKRCLAARPTQEQSA